MQFLRQSTASQEISLGQFLDSTDGDTEEGGLTIANTDIKIRKHGGTTLINKNSGGATVISNGVYQATLDATDTNTAGMLEIYVHVAGALAVKSVYMVLTATAFDALLTGTFNNLGGTAQTADNDTKLTTLLARIIGTLESGSHNPQSGDSFSRIGSAGASLTALQANLGQGIAQGGTAGTIQLASGETFATNELRGCVVNITLGTGKGQCRWISANIAVTNTCTIKPDWITTPDDTSIYEIVQGAASMQAILNTVLSESTSGLLANNFDTFYNNNNANTAKIVDDVGTSSPFPTSEWVWSTATSGIPAIGRLRGNNATVASITELSIHQESDAGKNTGLVISSLRAGDRIQIYFETNPEIFLIFDVTATPVLTGSVYAITGTVDATAGTFTNTGVSVSYEVTGAVQNRVEMDDNSVDLNTIISGVAAIPTTSAPTAVQNRQEMDSNSVDLNSLLSGQTTINNNVLLTALASVCTEARLAELDAANLPTDIAAIDTATMRGTDGANTVVPDAAGVAPTLAEILESQLTEAYAADGVAPTLTQAIFLIQQALTEFSIAGTSNTVKKIDGSTTAAVMTLNDAANPTSTTRTS